MTNKTASEWADTIKLASTPTVHVYDEIVKAIQSAMDQTKKQLHDNVAELCGYCIGPFIEDQDGNTCQKCGEYQSHPKHNYTDCLKDTIQSAMDQARSEERECCAKVCEEGTPNLTGSYKDTALHCAQLIRQRK